MSVNETNKVSPPSTTRACTSCRMLKIRCIPDDTAGQRKCQRCIRIGRDCIFPAPQKRKQRKRTDARVADLENQIRSLQSNLVDRKHGDNVHGRNALNQNPTSSASPSGEPRTGSAADRRQPPQEADTHLQDLWTDVQDGNSPFSAAMAKDLFATYNKKLVNHFPAVVFSDEATVESVARDKPTLFLAVMAVAARKLNPELAVILTDQMLQSYTTRAFLQSEKSLELVQAMMVTAIWYCPPEGSTGRDKHKFFEYIHMAATMALDLAPDAGSPATDTTTPAAADLTYSPNGGAIASDNGVNESESSMHEIERALVSSYVTCCGVAQSLRRPTLFRYNDRIKNCIERLSMSPVATLQDRRLVAWARLMQIVESFARDLSYEDLNNIASVDDPQTHVLFRIYEEQLAGWRLNLDTSIFNGSLELSYHHMCIYLHEIALHHDRNPEDFKPPFTFKRLYNSVRSSRASPCINIILRCVSSVQALIETFLHMDVDSLRTMPLFGFIRFAYGIIILEMIASPSGNTPYEYGIFLNRDSLQIDYYSSMVLKHLQVVVGPAHCRVPSFFLGMMLKLRAWHQRRPQLASPLGGSAQETGSHGSSSGGTPATGLGSLQGLSDHPSGFSEVSYTGIYDDDETGLPNASMAFASPPLQSIGGSEHLAGWTPGAVSREVTSVQPETAALDLGSFEQFPTQETGWIQPSPQDMKGLEDGMLLDIWGGGDQFEHDPATFVAPDVLNDFNRQAYAWN